jgi:hypothetical protein
VLSARWRFGLAVLLLCGACGSGTDAATPDPSLPAETAVPSAVAPQTPPSSTPLLESTTVPTTVPTTAPTTVPPTAPPVQFTWSAGPVPAEVRNRMDGISMRPGCPVGYDGLAYVRVGHWNFEGQVAEGELVIAVQEVEPLRAVFNRLFDIRFPIRRMTLVDDFGRASNPADGADDFASIEANNTSAFNCRRRTGSTSTFSQHSYGTAVDINPIENPYVNTAGTTSHPASVPFLDRSNASPGVITAGSPVVQAFESVGWKWGGYWDPPIDYQHFSRTGK